MYFSGFPEVQKISFNFGIMDFFRFFSSLKRTSHLGNRPSHVTSAPNQNPPIFAKPLLYIAITFEALMQLLNCLGKHAEKGFRFLAVGVGMQAFKKSGERS